MEYDDTLLTVAEAASLLRLQRATLWAWRRQGHGPRPINIGRRDGQRPVIRYRRADLIEFVVASHD